MSSSTSAEPSALIKFANIFSVKFCHFFLRTLDWTTVYKVLSFSEHTSIDYVIFETCNTLKDAIIREWNYMELDEVNSIRDYLLQHILNHPSTPVFVREKILQVRRENSF